MTNAAALVELSLCSNPTRCLSAERCEIGKLPFASSAWQRVSIAFPVFAA